MLREMPKLKHVGLNGPGITDEGLKIVSALTNFQSIVLEDTDITGEGIGRLENNKKLESLNLYGATVNDSTLCKSKNYLIFTTFNYFEHLCPIREW